MSWKFIVLILFPFIYITTCGPQIFKQERGKVLYANPEYVKDLHIFTFRENRRSPYLTTINVTSLIYAADNFTFRFDFINSMIQNFPVRFDFKTCDGLNTKWIKDWLKEYSNVPIDRCPISPGSYQISRFELPPKNFPFHFNYADYSGKTTIFHTTTKEKIAELSVELKFSG